MYKIAALAFAQVATAQFTCYTGVDDAAPYVRPATTTAACKFCAIGMKKTAMNWECDADWEFTTAVDTTLWAKGAICLTGEAILKNFASEAQVKEHLAMIDAEVEASKATATPITHEQALATLSATQMFYCNKVNCNTFISIADACKTGNTIAYDAAKDTGFWIKKDSAAIFLSASAALTAVFAMI